MVTGTLGSMTRDQAQEAIRSQGGRVTSGVSSRTDFLVMGADPGQAKVAAAKNNQVETLDEDGFLEMVGRGG